MYRNLIVEYEKKRKEKTAMKAILLNDDLAIFSLLMLNSRCYWYYLFYIITNFAGEQLTIHN
jgi:hypothetical protein